MQDNLARQKGRGMLSEEKPVKKSGFYDPHREKQNLFAERMKGHASPAMLAAIKSCHSQVVKVFSEDESRSKVVSVETCGNRFCPYCQARKARREADLIAYVMGHAKNRGLKAIFLTLTIPNVSGTEASSAVDKLNKALKRLLARKAFKRVVKGAIRKIEMTYNEDTGLFHPHVHLVLFVARSYFRSKFYLHTEQFADLWAKSMRLDQVVVHVEAADKAEKELAKYAAKSSSYLSSQRVFDVFYQVLKGRQLITFSGVCKGAVKDYKADVVATDEVEQEKGIQAMGCNRDSDNDNHSGKVQFTKIKTTIWNPITECYDTETREMTPFERRQFNSDNSRRFGRYWSKKLKRKRHKLV